jgi:THO complex subunit 2
VSSIIQSLSDDDYVSACSAFQELLRAGLDGKLEPAEAGRTLKDVFAATPGTGSHGPSLFLDTLSTVAEYDPTHPNLKDLVLSSDLSADLMREILDEPLLQTLGLIRSTFGRVFIRKQTNVLYRYER